MSSNNTYNKPSSNTITNSSINEIVLSRQNIQQSLFKLLIPKITEIINQNLVSMVKQVINNDPSTAQFDIDCKNSVGTKSSGDSQILSHPLID